MQAAECSKGHGPAQSTRCLFPRCAGLATVELSTAMNGPAIPSHPQSEESETFRPDSPPACSKEGMDLQFCRKSNLRTHMQSQPHANSARRRETSLHGGERCPSGPLRNDRFAEWRCRSLLVCSHWVETGLHLQPCRSESRMCFCPCFCLGLTNTHQRSNLTATQWHGTIRPTTNSTGSLRTTFADPHRIIPA